MHKRSGFCAECYVGVNFLPRNLKLKERAKELRKSGYLHDIKFWNAIKGGKIFGLDFHRQQIIGNFTVDFFAPKVGLVIELDGSSHDSKIEYDLDREIYLKSLGLTIIKFSAKDVLFDLIGVIAILKAFIEENFHSCRGVAGTKSPDGVYLERR